MIGRFVPYERMFLFIVAGRLIDRERALLLSPTRIRRRRQQQHQQRKRRQWPLWFCLWTPYRRTRNASTQVVRAGHSYWHLDTQESWERKVIAPLITEGMEKADCPTAKCLFCAAIVDDARHEDERIDDVAYRNTAIAIGENEVRRYGDDSSTVPVVVSISHRLVRGAPCGPLLERTPTTIQL
jgi:hypothetical protein